MSRIKDPKKIKALRWEYAYEIRENREGDRRLRSISQKRYAEGDYSIDNLIISNKSPKEIKENEKMYNEGFSGIADKTHSDDYLDTIKWGSLGGRPKKWVNDVERVKFRRALLKLNKGKNLLGEELELITKHGSLGRAMSNIEKVRLHRFRKSKKD